MVAQHEARRMTVAEWRALEAASPDCKHEYIDGWVYAMAGGTLDHSRIAINVQRALEDALGEGPCRVYNSAAAARLSPSRYTYPDAMATCDERDRGRITEVRTPRLIVEVLSDTTEAYDRGRKFAFYRACPSVEEYVLVASDYQGVEVYRRAVPRWTLQSYAPGDTIDLESLGVSVAVARFYRLTEVPLLDLDEPAGQV